MRPEQDVSIDFATLRPERQDALKVTQRYLRHTFRKVLADGMAVDIAEEPLHIQEPHIYATWSAQASLLGAGLKIGVCIQFDSQDGRSLLELHGKEGESLSDEHMLLQLQQYTDGILECMQRYCKAAGLITGISQASLSKAFSGTRRPSFQLLGGADDSWLLRIQDSVFYCTTHIIFDGSRDLELLRQSLATPSDSQDH